MDHPSLSTTALHAARTLIDATSTFNSTSTVAENQAALDRALQPLGDLPKGEAAHSEIASAAIICMQWLMTRAMEPRGGGREEILWSLREFISALEQGDPAVRHTTDSEDPL